MASCELAREFDLPVIVHARRAVDAVIAAIRRIGGLRGVVHSFSGSEEQARQLWDAGLPARPRRPGHLRARESPAQLAATMPLEFLLLETDAPDQPDADHRGQRNEPARLVDVLARRSPHCAARTARSTRDRHAANAERLFALRRRQHRRVSALA